MESFLGNNFFFSLYVPVSCGFAKNFLQSKISTNKPKNFKYGDDAYFICQKPGVADVIGEDKLLKCIFLVKINFVLIT